MSDTLTRSSFFCAFTSYDSLPAERDMLEWDSFDLGASFWSGLKLGLHNDLLCIIHDMLSGLVGVGRIIFSYWCILGHASSNLRWCILWRKVQKFNQPEGIVSQQDKSDVTLERVTKRHHLACSHLEPHRSLPTLHHSSLALFSLVFQYAGLGKCCCNHSRPLPSARNARWKHTSRYTAVMVQLSCCGCYWTVGMYWV